MPDLPLDMDIYTLFGRFAAAVGLGLLVGLEREWAKSGSHPLFAGIRTFPSISMLGCTAAFVTHTQGMDLFLSVAFFGFCLLVGISHYASSVGHGAGVTTEVTSLLLFLLGALCFWGHLLLAASLAVVLTGLLSLKEPLHKLARTLDKTDIHATLKFAAVTIIVLPLLPNEALNLGEGLEFLSVINPRKVWLLVVLVSAVGLFGYVAAKVWGARRGIAITGLMGGLASSTAVTASMAQRSHERKELSSEFALAIIMACTVMFPRTIIEVAFVDHRLAFYLVLPLLGAAAFGLVASMYLFSRQSHQPGNDLVLENPFRLGPAVKFGLLFGSVLIVAKLAHQHFDHMGVFVVAAVGGFIDCRPIALSVADQAAQGDLPRHAAVAAVMIAALSNTLLKAGYAIFLGGRKLRRLLIPAFTLLITGGVLAVYVVLRYGEQWL